MPVVYVMIKPASGLCNMRCKYCFYADEMENRSQGSYGVMTLATLENVIQKTLQFAEGECTIAYQGGEPTLAGLAFFEESIRLQEKYNKNGVKIHNALQTNGYGMNEDWCRFFAKHHFLIGLSVDGIKATHDAYRKDSAGNDTYLRVMEAVRLLERHKVDFNILTVVNAKTAPKIRKIYEKYQKQGFHYQQYIACLDPIGKPPGEEEFSLTPKVYGQFLIDLFELWALDLKTGSQPYIRQFENWIGILLGMPPEACEQNGICSDQNIVEADGSVYPCDFYVLDDYCIGNLNQDTMEQIYENRKKLKFRENSQNHTAACRACQYFALCRGGCRRCRDSQGMPELLEADNIFCEAYRMFFDKCLPEMMEIARNIRR